ncbi:acyltransferase family protein [Salinicoccus sp. HZC-1]|uniref:acyltransferase family protein n=1 Tax=Salinicoccus sp. HZC-1 TaxID=3385497 RepID=UPI00398BA61E
MSQRKRFTEIDALRGLAALAVVLFHYTTRYEERFGGESGGYSEIFSFGEFGVQLFFIISGFVIYMSILKVKSVSDFAIKRSFRLYPAYIFAVVLTFTVVTLASIEQLKIDLLPALVNLTMFQDFFGAPRVDGVYWTLRVEMTFYILMAILLFFKVEKKVMPIVLTWISASVIIQLIHRSMDTDLTALIREFSIASFSHMFIIGIMFYCIWQHGDQLKYYAVIALCVIYDLAFMSIENALFTAAFVAAFYLIINNKMQFLSSPVLVFFGTISYPLYLIHQNIGYVILNKMHEMGYTHPIFTAMLVGATILAAYIIFRYVEQPVQNALYKLYKGQQKPRPKKVGFKQPVKKI